MPKYFKMCEFDQKGLPHSGENHMDMDFVAKLDKIREECGFPFIISSGWRSPAYNDKVSNTGHTGPHTTGRAVDILCYGERAFKLIQIALKYGITGIGLSQKGPFASRYIHLDDLKLSEGYPRPTIWTY